MNNLSVKSLSNLKKEKKKNYPNLKICTKPKCVRSIRRRLPPVRVPNLTEEETWTIKTLPTDWTPISTPSDVIDNVMKSREERHEYVIKKISENYESINNTVEYLIRTNGENLKGLFAELECKTQSLIISLSSQDDKEKLKLTKEHFESTANSVNFLYADYRTHLKRYYLFLNKTEQWRSNNLKIVLKWAYKSLHDVSYKLPYELQQYFEHEILEINQMLLNNFRCYEELQVSLKLQAENSKRVYLQNLDEIKIYWRDLEKRHAIMQLNEKKLLQANCEEIMLSSERGKRASTEFSTSREKVTNTWKSMSQFPVTTEFAVDWTNNLVGTIEELDTCAKTLINLYKLAIVHVFEGYFEELQNLTTDMVDTKSVNNYEINAISSELCKPNIELATQQYSQDITTLQNFWETNMQLLNEKLQHTSIFLHEAAHLWDLHYIRLNEIKRLVLVELRKQIAENDNIPRSMEVEMDAAVDLLRSAPTIEKLEECLENMERLFEIRKKAYFANYIKEIKVIEKYEAFVEQEIEILTSELQLFLQIHPKEVNPTEQRTRASQQTCSDKRMSVVLPEQMNRCKSQIESLQNWMYGLWEAIERYILTCQSETQQEALKWIESYSGKIAKRHEVKNAFHSFRFYRVKETIYANRQLEITKHVERINRHKAGAENEISELKDVYSNFESKYTALIEDCKNHVSTIKARRKEAIKSTKVKALIQEIKSTIATCNEKIDTLSEELKTIYNGILDKISEASLEFCRKIKLFTEDGSFHPDEGKKVMGDLKKFDKTIVKKYNVVIKEILKRESKIFQDMTSLEQDVFNVLNNQFEELKFTESAKAAIKQLQVQLKNEAYSAKFKQNRLKGAFKTLQEKQLQCLGKLEFLNDFDLDWSVMKSCLNEATIYLYQSQVINATNRFCGPQEKPDDYVFALFNCVPSESDKFSSKMCRYIYKSMLSLESEAKDFYSRHKYIENQEQVQPSFDDFMNEVLEKFSFYYLQCELVWLNEVHEFLNVLYALYEFLNIYVKLFLATHCRNHIEDFRTRHQKFLNEVGEIKNNNTEKLQKVKNKLKIIHGCANNRQMLKELEAEMVQLVDEINEYNIGELLQPYWEIQENGFALFKNELVESRERLATLYNESIVELLNNSLIRQFEKKWSYINDLIIKPIENEEGETSKSKEEYCKKIRHMILPEEFEDVIKTFKKLKMEAPEVSYTDSEYDMHPCRLIRAFTEEFDYYLTYIDSIENCWYTDIQTQHDQFKIDVQEVLKLYTMKYENGT